MDFPGPSRTPEELLLTPSAKFWFRPRRKMLITSRNADRVKSKILARVQTARRRRPPTIVLAEKRVFVIPDIIGECRRGDHHLL